MVGAAFTQAYASPEQLRGEPVSTAVDVFALGTLFCELLTGARPKWAVEKDALRPGDQPLGLDTIADADLRAIVGKALAVDAAERYSTVTAFDEDINRYLSHEPVRARASTHWYRLRKFLGRNKWPVFAAAAAGLAIVASLGIAIWQLQEAREGRSQALQEASRANQVTAFVTSLFRASDLRTPSAQDKRSLTALQLLDAGRERLKGELNDQPETKVALLAVLAEVYGIMGDEERFQALNKERIRFASERLGPLHPAALNGRAWRDEAWALVKQAFTTERQPSTDSFGVSEQYYVRGLMLLAENRFADAQTDLSRAVTGWRTAGNHPLRLRAAEAALDQAQKSLAKR